MMGLRMNKQKGIIILLFLVLGYLSFNAYATLEEESLDYFSLKDVEESIIKNSGQLKVKDEEVNLQKLNVDVFKSDSHLKIFLDGKYQYLEEIPELDLLPNKTMKFGSHDNYSVGITANYKLLDFNKNNLVVEANKNLLDAKKLEYQKVKKDQLYLGRSLYIDLILLKEERKILSESLKIAKSQFKEVKLKQNIGTSSNLDLSSSSKELNELEIKLQQNKNNILAIQTEIVKVSQIRDVKFFIKNYKNIQKIKLDTFEDIIKKFKKYTKFNFKNFISIEEKILGHNSEASELESKSILKKRLPELTLFARSSLEYPMGPEIKEIHQNAIGIKLSMPLFDGGTIRKSSELKMAQSKTLEYQKEDIYFSKVYTTMSLQEKVSLLEEEQKLIKLKIEDTNKISNLVFDRYKAGKITFLDVERANSKYRESRLLLTKNLGQITKTLIALAGYAGE